MVELSCRCGRQLQVPESHLGKSGRCPFCKQTVRLIGPGFRAGTDRFAATLLCIGGPKHVGELLMLGGPGPIEIGKLPDRHIKLNDQKVSRRHCRLSRVDDGWCLEDNRSTNGVYVNDNRVSQQVLADSDLVRIGDFEFKYVVIDEFEPVGAAAPESEVEAVTARAASEADESVGLVSDTFDDGGLLGDDIYALAEEAESSEAIEVPRSDMEAATAGEGRAAPAVEGGGPTCPSCNRQLAVNAKICVQCGINLATGRSIMTTQEDNLDQIYATAEGLIRWMSWIFWWGIYPIASEAFGTVKPYVIRGIAITTIVISFWYFMYEYSIWEGMGAQKQIMLWPKNPKQDAEHIYDMYLLTNYGDDEAFFDELDSLEQEALARQVGNEGERAQADTTADDEPARAPQIDPAFEDEIAWLRALEARGTRREDLVIQAHESLPLE